MLTRYLITSAVLLMGLTAYGCLALAFGMAAAGDQLMGRR